MMHAFTAIYYSNRNRFDAPNSRLLRYCFDQLCWSVREAGGRLIAVCRCSSDQAHLRDLAKSSPGLHVEIIDFHGGAAGHADIYRRILEGLDYAFSNGTCNEPVFLCEHDVIYSQEYLSYMTDEIKAQSSLIPLVYSNNVVYCTRRGYLLMDPVYKMLSTLSGQANPVRMAIHDKYMTSLSAVPEWAEPGTKEGVDFAKAHGPVVIDVRDGYNLTGDRHPQEGERALMHVQGLPAWPELARNFWPSKIIDAAIAEHGG